MDRSSPSPRLTVMRLEDRVVPAGLAAAYFDLVQSATDNYARARADVVRAYADQYQQGQQYALAQWQNLAAAEGQVFGDGQAQAQAIAAVAEAIGQQLREYETTIANRFAEDVASTEAQKQDAIGAVAADPAATPQSLQSQVAAILAWARAREEALTADASRQALAVEEQLRQLDAGQQALYKSLVDDALAKFNQLEAAKRQLAIAYNSYNAAILNQALARVAQLEKALNAQLAAIQAAYLSGSLSDPSLSAPEVEALLRRAAAASRTSDAIIAIVDRNGRILGVRVEGGVSPTITGDVNNFVFAVDGAVSLARTGAFFGNNQAPLTSRTVQFISQSTITQREVNSDPNVTDVNSPLRGPGFVAPVGIKAHFPPNVASTPQVDLFQIEHTNRDGTFHVGADGVKGTADDVQLAQRFNIDPAFVPPGQSLFPPDSYGFVSGLLPGAQNRGIATLPGGIPIFKNGQVVGGIGVFFPGRTGFATEENSSLSTTYNPALPDRSLEAEWIAFAAAGGSRTAVGSVPLAPVGDLGGVPLPAGFGLPAGRIDLVGIQLDVFGPGGSVQGPGVLLQVGNAVGRGNPNDGFDAPIGGGLTLRDGLPVPDGWLVVPHDGVGITAGEVNAVIAQGLAQAATTRAAIRLPIGSRAKFVFAVADLNGNVVGLYREPDATVFSIDVAVAKARNVAYYANPAQVQPIDLLPGVAPGFAFTNRTFRYLGEPRFPEGIDGTPPAPFSQLNDDPLGTNRLNAVQVGPPLPASAYQSVVGHDAFNPGTNFHDPLNILNQNGIVFFPGSAPLYRGPGLIGGFGVSGDGVDQDDVTTVGGQAGFDAPLSLRADQIIFNGVRLPYQKFNRNPEG